MREVIGLGQLRSHACGYLDRVGAGETIDVVRRGKLVARVAPIPERSMKATAAGGWVVGLDELRTRAGRCFDRVAAGETIDVVRRGELVARIESAARDEPRRTA
ncbi:hypothetical protein GCM10009641_08550 [Mycobacterium cookii]|uniref:Antitoxin n=1 Tax=Mycobacterium cookii TaxID=1775 RepID=A0A7I7L2S0_9MYCO|nr:hypothetical protein MCOO_41160 [Mycobacterium cookii]